MTFSEDSITPSRETLYLQAGWVYLGLGSAILLVTAASPGLLAAERRADLIHLLVGLPFFVLFALMIGRGDRLFSWPLRPFAGPEKARSVGRWCQEKLTMLLSVSALGRTLVFFANAAGWRPRWRPALRFEPAEPDLRMLINALLMAVIFVFLVRASWIPWWRRVTGGSKAR